MINVLIVALMGVSAFASLLPNVNGMAGRLEILSCEGANMVKASKAAQVYQAAEASCAGAPEININTCFEKAVKKNTTFVAANFKGVAIPETKQFKMTIKSTSGMQLFSSIREGYHGDANNNGIVLFFNRVGMTGDSYMIESGRLSNDARSVPSLIVPVNRRAIFGDDVYFFFNCTLRWIY